MLSPIVAAGLLAGALVLSACGSDSLAQDDDRTVRVETAVDEAAAAEVPAEIKARGTITVGTDAIYAPLEFLAGDGETIQGFDIDLFNAVAAKLGLTAGYQNAKFDTIITGVSGRKYDVGVSSFTINAERQKQAAMVSYFSAGTQWAAAAGNPTDVDPGAPCDATVAVQKGTVQDEVDLPSKVSACEKQGNPIKVLTYAGQDQVTAAVAIGKADAMLADSPVVAYAVQQSKGKLEAVGDIYDAAPYGFVLSPENQGMAQAIVLALQSLQEDGNYAKVLESWGFEAGAIDDFSVNPIS